MTFRIEDRKFTHLNSFWNHEGAKRASFKAKCPQNPHKMASKPPQVAVKTRFSASPTSKTQSRGQTLGVDFSTQVTPNFRPQFSRVTVAPKAPEKFFWCLNPRGGVGGAGRKVGGAVWIGLLTKSYKSARTAGIFPGPARPARFQLRFGPARPAPEMLFQDIRVSSSVLESKTHEIENQRNTGGIKT